MNRHLLTVIALFVLTGAAALVVAGAQASASPTQTADPKPITEYDVSRAPWPQVRGPYGNGSAPELGLRLVDDLSKARLAWKSEALVPGSSPATGKGAPKAGGSFGGEYCTPIVADGRVYLSYWRLSGRRDWGITEDDLKYWVRSGRNPVNDRPETDTADDILLCADAATGRTVWEKVAGQGRPIAGYKSGAHMACAWWDGKVFFAGSSSKLYCLDGTTGDVLWVAGGRGKGGGRDTQFGTPLVSGGVVFMDGVGRDTGTGQELWRLARDAGKGQADFGVPWLHRGVAHFIFGGSLVEARTGKILWTIPRPPTGCGSGVCGDVLVVANREGGYRNRGTGNDPSTWPTKGMTAFRISPESYEELWQAPLPHGHGSLYITAVIHRGRAIGEMIKLPGDDNIGYHGVAVDLGKGPGSILTTTNRLPLGYAPLAAEGRLIGGSGYALTMYSLEPGDFGAPMGRLQIAEVTNAAYAEGRLYFRQLESAGPVASAKDDDDETEVAGPAGAYRLVCYDLAPGQPRKAVAQSAASRQGR